MSDDPNFLDNPRMMYGGWFAPDESIVPPPDHEALTPEQQRAVEYLAGRIAQNEIAKRTIPRAPAYFMNGQWLVTYEWLQATVNPLRQEIVVLQCQIQALQQRERPWWKRWFA